MAASPTVTIKCGSCGRSFTWRRPPQGGGRPKHCPEHRDPRNRRRDARRAKVRGDDDIADALLGGGGSPTEARTAMEPEYMAVGLSLRDDPAEAAAIVGIVGRTTRQLEALAARARKEHPGLINAQNAALGKQLFAALAVHTLNAQVMAPRCSAAQSSAAVKSLASAMEAVTGGAKNVYSKVLIVFAEGEA